MVFMGIDVGNTKTAFLLCDENGHVISFLKKEGANFQSCGGIEKTLEILRSGIDELFKRGKVKKEELKFTYLGIAGADREADFKLIESALRRLDIGDFSFQNDGFIALRSGSVDGKGILITCGTGNTNFASNGKKVERIGGLSPQLGDVIGTHLIASKVTSAAVRAKDGRGSRSSLVKILEKKLQMEVEDLISVDFRKFDPVPKIIESLFEALKEFDLVAFSIMREIVDEINRIAEIFRFSLFPKERNVRLILDGPFFKNADSIFFKILQNYIWPGYEVYVPEHDPVVGAVLLAMEKRIEVNEEIFTRVTNEYLLKRKEGV